MNRLKELREDSGLTLTELSKELAKSGISITPDALSKYERGDREPKIEVWKKLAKYFDVTIQFIQGETFGKNDILKFINDTYITNEYSKNDIEKEIIKNNLTLYQIALYQRTRDYLIFKRTYLPERKFKKEELKRFTYSVKNYWFNHFKFVFNKYKISSIMQYGGSEKSLANALASVIYEQYLSESKTVISMDFDQVVGLDLERFEQNKNMLLRFGSKDEISKSVNDVINSLIAFRDSLDVLPDNTPKPTEDDALDDLPF